MYIAPIVLRIGYIGETRIRFFELSKGQYRGKTFMNDEEKLEMYGMYRDTKIFDDMWGADYRHLNDRNKNKWDPEEYYKLVSKIHNKR